MPFDGVFTNSIVKELSLYINSKIEKIHQPNRDEILLVAKHERKNIKILFSSNPSYPRIHITEYTKENPLVPPTFCMILRKYLTGGRIVEVNQINFDRIVELKIESRDELGFPVNYYLVIEIMGKHSNIMLLSENRVILDSIKHIGSNINRYREVLPGAKYVLPPTQDKNSPLNITKEELNNLLSNTQNTSAAKFFSDKFLGISKIFASEICGETSDKRISDLTHQELEIVIANFFYFISRIKSGDFNFVLYYEASSMKDFYAFTLKKYSELSYNNFESPGKLLDTYYNEKNLRDSLKQKYNDVFKLVTNLIERNSKKIQIHLTNLEQYKDYNNWKVLADLIMANQYSIKTGSSEIEVENFYDPEFSLIKIPMDPSLTPVENAQKYYKKYNKEKSTIEMSKKQLIESHNEQYYLESILYNLEKAVDTDTIEEIKSELSQLGYIKKRKNNQKQKKSNPYHYRSSDGFDIYVGKNNNQNDFLTTKFAVASDIWMHTKNIPGSHVIIKSVGGRVSDTALFEGACLAAYYSKAKNSSSVPVDYTERKNVKKPSGSKPGMVIYYTNKTIYVNSDEEAVKNINLIN